MMADMQGEWGFHALGGRLNAGAFQKGDLAVTVKIQTKQASWSTGFCSENLPCAGICNM